MLDLGLPDMDGFHVIRLLKVEGIETPILLQSGLSGPELSSGSAELDENEFLAKPFNISELIERMNEIVARSGAANAEASAERDAETPAEESAHPESGTSQSQESEQPDELDGRQRRRHARTPMFGTALMIGADGKPMPCEIVDMSEGCRALKLADGGQECPTIFTLYTEDPKRRWQCGLRWRRKDRIGVEFQ